MSIEPNINSDAVTVSVVNADQIIVLIPELFFKLCSSEKLLSPTSSRPVSEILILSASKIKNKYQLFILVLV